MSAENPYSPGFTESLDSSGIRKVSVNPISLMSRSIALMGDQYWMFLGVCLVGILIGSLVPFGLVLGAMMVGIYLCFLEQERSGRIEFATLFRGFDQFVDSLVTILIQLAFSFVVMLPLMGVFIAVIMFPLLEAAQAAQNAPPGTPPPMPAMSVIGILAFYPLIIAASLLVWLPFAFAFQLIADRKLPAVEAVKMSFRGVWKNLFGVTFALIAFSFINLLAVMMCFVPSLFLMPVVFGAFFVLYRDIYGAPNQGANA